MSMISDILNSAVNNVRKEKNEFDVEKWAEQKNEKRQWAYKTQDEMATKIVQDEENYRTYLDVQSRFSSYSAGNALLVMAQNPKATQLKDKDGWKKDNIHFARKPNPITILEKGNVYEREDGTEAQNYNTKNVYDISDMKVNKKLNTIPYTSESIMRAVTSMAQVPIDVVKDTNIDKAVSYNADKRVIEVSENAEIEETIQGLVREIASIHLFAVAKSEMNNLKTESVAYMISKRYGLPISSYNFEKIPEELKQMTPQEIKAELSKIAECYKILTEGMDRTIGIEPKSKANRNYER